MKKFFFPVLIFLTIAIVIVGCGSSDTSSSGNAELEGTWTETVSDSGIGTVTITLTFIGNNWDLIETLDSSTMLQMSGTFTLDSTANPKTLDLYITACSMAPEQVGATLYEIYQLSGNNLALASGQGGTRPASFTADNTANLVKQ